MAPNRSKPDGPASSMGRFTVQRHSSRPETGFIRQRTIGFDAACRGIRMTGASAAGCTWRASRPHGPMSARRQRWPKAMIFISHLTDAPPRRQRQDQELVSTGRPRRRTFSTTVAGHGSRFLSSVSAFGENALTLCFQAIPDGKPLHGFLGGAPGSQQGSSASARRVTAYALCGAGASILVGWIAMLWHRPAIPTYIQRRMMPAQAFSPVMPAVDVSTPWSCFATLPAWKESVRKTCG